MIQLYTVLWWLWKCVFFICCISWISLYIVRFHFISFMCVCVWIEVCPWIIFLRNMHTKFFSHLLLLFIHAYFPLSSSISVCLLIEMSVVFWEKKVNFLTKNDTVLFTFLNSMEIIFSNVLLFCVQYTHIGNYYFLFFFFFFGFNLILNFLFEKQIEDIEPHEFEK